MPMADVQRANAEWIKSEWKGSRWRSKLCKGKPLLRFKIYVRHGRGQRSKSPFFWVTVWKTVKEMRARFRELTAAEHASDRMNNAMGACFSWRITVFNSAPPHPDSEAGIILEEMGEIVLCKQWCRVGIIAHECGHAAHRVMERMREEHITDQETDEERFCIILGDLNLQIIKAYFGMGRNEL